MIVCEHNGEHIDADCHDDYNGSDDGNVRKLMKIIMIIVTEGINIQRISC